jgi:hypothetical protein
VRFGGAASYVQDLYELCNIWLPQAETERIKNYPTPCTPCIEEQCCQTPEYYHKIRETNVVRSSSYTKKKQIINTASVPYYNYRLSLHWQHETPYNLPSV